MTGTATTATTEARMKRTRKTDWQDIAATAVAHEFVRLNADEPNEEYLRHALKMRNLFPGPRQFKRMFTTFASASVILRNAKT